MHDFYLDHNAATPLLPEAEEAAVRVWRGVFGNPSSLHAQGREARRFLEEARECVAAHWGCKPQEILFTSGGTESDNLALRGVMRHERNARRHLVVSAFEHPAVLETARDLATQGYALSEVAPNEDGLVTPEALQALLRSRPSETALVSVLWAHNEIGTLQPIEELARLAHEAGALFHSDGVQAWGKGGRSRVTDLGVDLLSLSGHKIGGPKGAGVLYVRQGTPLQALQTGGPQERQTRAGTENVAACVGMAAALQAWEKNGEIWRQNMRQSRDALKAELMALLPEMQINGSAAFALPNTLHVTLPGCPSDLMVLALDMQGIAVSAGSACASGSVKRSQAMLAMGKDSVSAQCVLRFSLGPLAKVEQMSIVANKVAAVAKHIRGMGRGISAF